MSALFDKDFEHRAELQRRQQYHQRLLDSQRFRRQPAGDASGFKPYQDAGYSRSSEDQDGILSRILFFLGAIFFFYTIPAALVSAVIALLYSAVVTVVVRHGFADTFRGAFRIVFIALTVIAVGAVVVLH